MNLASKFTLIEEMKEDIRKYFFCLKKEVEKNGSIPDKKRREATCYAKEILEKANKEFFAVTLQIDAIIKRDRVAKQLVRNISSIQNYRQKIDELCNV